MISEKKLAELRKMVFEDYPQTKPCPTQWEIYREAFDTIEVLWRVTRVARKILPTLSCTMHDCRKKFILDRINEFASLRSLLATERDAWKERFHTADNLLTVEKFKAERLAKVAKNFIKINSGLSGMESYQAIAALLEFEGKEK